MVIYTDIKPLIVAGFVLVLINSSDSLPLPQQRKTQDSGSNGRLTMLKKSCIDSLGNIGICMFKWDCISQKGVTLSTCVDGFLFGACCSLKEEPKDKLTSDNYTKSSTDSNYEKSNAISLITLGYIERTKSSIHQEEARVNHTSFTNFNEYSEISLDGFTVDSFDSNNTSSEVNFPINATDRNDNYFEYSSEILPNISIGSNYSHLNFGESNIDNFSVEGVNNSSTTVFIEDILQLGSESRTNNYSSIKLKTTQYYNNLKVTTWENFIEDYSTTLTTLVEETVKDNGEEVTRADENLTSISTEPNSTENSIFSETTQSKPITKETIPYDLLNVENNKLEFRNKFQNNTFVNSTQKFIGEKNYINKNNNSNSNKESFTTKDIVPPVWDDYTSLLPSSFQALISQLTSREASGTRPNVLPTTQSNLTTNNFISNKTENYGLLYDSNLNNSKITANNHERTTVESTYEDELANTLTTSNVELENQENLKITQSADVTEYENTTALHDINDKELANETDNLYYGVTYYSSNSNMRGSSDRENNEIVPAVAFSKYDPTQSLDLLNSYPKKELDVPNSKENELKVENCSKFPTKSPNEQFNILYSSSQSNLKEIEDPTLSFIKNTLTPFITPNYENKEILTTLSLDSGTKSSIDKEIPDSKNLTKISDNEKDKGHVQYQNVQADQDIVDMHSSLDHATSLSSSFDNEEFLFDITTEVLTYFTKADVTNPDSSTTTEINYVLSTIELVKNDTYEITKQNLFTPSQITTEQISSSSPENTTENNVSSLSENYEGESSGLPVFPEDFLTTIYKIENSLDTESTKSDFEPTKNLSEIHSTTGNNQYQEDVLFESSVPEDFNTNLNVHFTNTVFTPQILAINNHTVVTPYTEETNSSLIENYHSGTNNLQTEPSLTLNLLQTITSIYDANATESRVNTTISTTIEGISFADALNNQSNHPATMPLTNVYDDIFNNSDTTFAINTSLFSHNETSSESYSMPPALGSSSSSMTETFSTSLKTTQVQTSDEQVIKNKWDYKKDCGVRPMQPIGRIVGGRNTYFGKWPWQALVKEATWLGLFVKNKCGGVLITSKYVLTAAHCQPGFLASLLVVLGTHDISNLKDNGAPVIRNVKRMVVHRHYNPQTFENDLALLEMDTELEFLPHVVPICLPHRYEDFTGEMAFVTGWGKLTHGGDVPNILQEVQVPIVANSECQMMFYQAGHHKAIQNNFVCAGYTNGGQDSCEGDSGGPLMVQRKDKRWVLVGTVSHGIGCADPNLPGVYMRMSSYRPWIDSIINK